MYIDDTVMAAIRVARTDINTGMSILDIDTKKSPTEKDKFKSAEYFFIEARNLLELLIRANKD